MGLFDGNCMVGPWRERKPHSYTDVDGLITAMERYGINEALVYHSLAKHFHPTTGNHELMTCIRGRANLHPCWVLLPHHTGEMSPPKELLSEMAEAGVRAVRLCPKAHELTLAPWCVGDLLEALAAHRVPIIVDFDNLHWGELVDWQGLAWMCAEFPDLPVIATRMSIASDRRLYPLLEQCPNLYIELSYYQVHRGIEALAERFGAERMIFGSGMPVFDPGLPLAGLSYSGVSDDDYTKIAEGNLRRLLEGAYR